VCFAACCRVHRGIRSTCVYGSHAGKVYVANYAVLDVMTDDSGVAWLEYRGAQEDSSRTACSARRAISSSETSSTCVAKYHAVPVESRTPDMRSP
jgi:hypothetical protein